jgi:hypothetical protein
MSEDLEPLTTDDGGAVSIGHRPILIKMAGVILIGAIAGFVFFSPNAGLGVLIGGVLAFANYLWQRNSLKAIFDRAVHGKPARFLALRYILRYFALGAVLSVIWFTQTVSMYAVIFGLSSFAAAVVIEGFTNIFSGTGKES